VIVGALDAFWRSEGCGRGLRKNSVIGIAFEKAKKLVSTLNTSNAFPARLVTAIDTFRIPAPVENSYPIVV
jgi:hypothetical protein